MCKRCAWSKLGEFCCIARNPLLHYDYFSNLSNQPVFLPISHGGVKQRGKTWLVPQAMPDKVNEYLKSVVVSKRSALYLGIYISLKTTKNSLYTIER